MAGKHTPERIKIKQLEDTIKRKDREIFEIKNSLADILLEIRKLNESNNYSDPSIKKRKISELCTDTRYELLIDNENEQQKEEKAKIIELPNTRKSK